VSRGCLIFAHNNGDIDYVKLAEASAKRIEHYLGLPTTIITDETATTESTRWFADYDKAVKWKNSGRSRAYELSPYDETILLDADYVVNSDQLLRLFDIQQDFLCHRVSNSITGTNWSNRLESFGEYKFPMWWATVVYFRKTERARAIFDAMAMVEANYTHYANLYNFKHRPFRNDYALSIAIGIASGHILNTEFDIPWTLQAVPPEVTVKQHEKGYKFVYGNKHLLVDNQDFHAMGKKHLSKLYED